MVFEKGCYVVQRTIDSIGTFLGVSMESPPVPYFPSDSIGQQIIPEQTAR